MSLSVLATADGGYSLFRGAERVGWVEGRSVALAGFETADDARRAARVAYEALRRWLARQRPIDLPDPGRGQLSIRRQGNRAHLVLRGISVGRLVEPEHVPDRVPGFGFELHLPQGFGPVAGIGAAQVIHHAIARRAPERKLAATAGAS